MSLGNKKSPVVAQAKSSVRKVNTVTFDCWRKAAHEKGKAIWNPLYLSKLPRMDKYHFSFPFGNCEGGVSKHQSERRQFEWTRVRNGYFLMKV